MFFSSQHRHSKWKTTARKAFRQSSQQEFLILYLVTSQQILSLRSGPVGCSWVMYLGQEFLWTETLLCTLVPEVFLDFFFAKAIKSKPRSGDNESRATRCSRFAACSWSLSRRKIKKNLWDQGTYYAEKYCDKRFLDRVINLIPDSGSKALWSLIPFSWALSPFRWYLIPVIFLALSPEPIYHIITTLWFAPSANEFYIYL